jgi:hypothetical protein
MGGAENSSVRAVHATAVGSRSQPLSLVGSRATATAVATRSTSTGAVATAKRASAQRERLVPRSTVSGCRRFGSKKRGLRAAHRPFPWQSVGILPTASVGTALVTAAAAAHAKPTALARKGHPKASVLAGKPVNLARLLSEEHLVFPDRPAGLAELRTHSCQLGLGDPK